jgi:4-azaleucine resistance transporter AzlC
MQTVPPPTSEAETADQAPTMALAPALPEDREERGFTCSMDAFRGGLRGSVAIALGPLVWGISMGVVASDAGFTWLGSLVMSVLVYSGTAQMLAVDMIERDAGIVAILVSSVLVSLRYILMGMTMSGWFRTTPGKVFWPGIHALSDQSWAMMVQQVRTGHRDVGYFFGVNVGMLATWTAGTLLGASLGGLLGGHVDGLHFASTAALVGILAGMKVRRFDILPWIVTGATAIVASELIGGSWFVFLGIAAGLATVFLTGGTHDQR